MAIHRTYVLKMPSNPGSMPYLDILVEGPVGGPWPAVGNWTPRLPVVNQNAVFLNTTTGLPITLVPPSNTGATPNCVFAPSAWQVFDNDVQGDGTFYEWRGRVLRCEVRAGQDGFVPRFRLGWLASLHKSLEDTCLIPNDIQYSESLLGLVSDLDQTIVGGLGVTVSIPDPGYGGVQVPVIRVGNTAEVAGGLFYLQLTIFEAKDEDRNPTTVP